MMSGGHDTHVGGLSHDGYRRKWCDRHLNRTHSGNVTTITGRTTAPPLKVYGRFTRTRHVRGGRERSTISTPGYGLGGRRKKWLPITHTTPATRDVHAEFVIFIFRCDCRTYGFRRRRTRSRRSRKTCSFHRRFAPWSVHARIAYNQSVRATWWGVSSSVGGGGIGETLTSGPGAVGGVRGGEKKEENNDNNDQRSTGGSRGGGVRWRDAETGVAVR